MRDFALGPASDNGATPGHRPRYLDHLTVRRRSPAKADHAYLVVLPAAARTLLPQHYQQRTADIPAGRELYLGVVTPLAWSGPAGRPALWTYTRMGRPHVAGPRLYRSRHDAAESCAIEAISGRHARQDFDLDRWHRHRPTDN